MAMPNTFRQYTKLDGKLIVQLPHFMQFPLNTLKKKVFPFAKCPLFPLFNVGIQSL